MLTKKEILTICNALSEADRFDGLAAQGRPNCAVLRAEAVKNRQLTLKLLANLTELQRAA